jgi:hypothetical protein
MSTRQKLVNWTVAASFIIVMIIWWLYTKKNPDDYRYTIANVYKLEAVLDGDALAHTTYTINGKEYKGSVSSYTGSKFLQIGDRIYFMYLIANPEYGEAVSEKLVPDTINVIPPSGWKKLP